MDVQTDLDHPANMPQRSIDMIGGSSLKLVLHRFPTEKTKSRVWTSTLDLIANPGIGGQNLGSVGGWRGTAS
ncbi:Actin-related protein 4 [Fusarium oxysporum f. sp. albedinis]|nr:Actin-related protein 4 [Fusarium oxysporum f. sp. albedinis]